MLRPWYHIFPVLLLLFSSTNAQERERQVAEAIDFSANLEVLLSGTAGEDEADEIKRFLFELDAWDGATTNDKDALASLRSGFQAIDPALKTVREVVAGLTGEDGITEDTLALIKSTCGASEVAGIDVFAILANSSSSSREVEASVRGVRNIAHSCSIAVERAKKDIDQALVIIEAALERASLELKELEDQLAAATDPAERDRIADEIERKKAEIQEQRDKQKRAKDAKKKLDTLQFAIGVILMASAGIMMVVSGGTCSALCGKLFALGVTNVATAVANAQGTERVGWTEIPGQPEQYVGLELDAKPSTQDIESFKRSTSDLNIIPPADPGGNYRVGTGSDGSIVVLQVVPTMEVARVLPENISFTSISNVEIENFGSVSWRQVDVVDLDAYSVFFSLSGEVEQNNVQVAFTQSSISGSTFTVTVLARE